MQRLQYTSLTGSAVVSPDGVVDSSISFLVVDSPPVVPVGTSALVVFVTSVTVVGNSSVVSVTSVTVEGASSVVSVIESVVMSVAIVSVTVETGPSVVSDTLVPSVVAVGSTVAVIMIAVFDEKNYIRILKLIHLFFKFKMKIFTYLGHHHHHGHG